MEGSPVFDRSFDAERAEKLPIYRYTVYGLVVASEVELPELVTSAANVISINLTYS